MVANILTAFYFFSFNSISMRFSLGFFCAAFLELPLFTELPTATFLSKKLCVLLLRTVCGPPDVMHVKALQPYLGYMVNNIGWWELKSNICKATNCSTLAYKFLSKEFSDVYNEWASTSFVSWWYSCKIGHVPFWKRSTQATVLSAGMHIIYQLTTCFPS